MSILKRAINEGRARSGYALCAVLAALLSACGGGGQGSAQPSQSPTPLQSLPTLTLWRSYLQLQREYNLAEPAVGGGYVIRTFEAPVAEAVPFSGVQASRSRVREVAEFNPALNLGPSDNGYNDIFADAAGTPVGARRYVGGYDPVCSVPLAATLPPASAAIGASGAIATFVQTNGCDANAIRFDYQLEVTWALKTDSSLPGMNFFCVKDREGSSLFGFSYNELCIEARADGSLGTNARLTYDDQFFYRAK